MPKIILIILLILISGCGNYVEEGNNSGAIGVVGENMPITRGEAAKIAALCKYSTDEINNLERVITFEDTNINLWYDKYINAAFTAGLMSGTSENKFSPDEMLSISQADNLIGKLNTSGSFALKYEDRDKDRPIAYSVWLEGVTKACSNVTQCDIFLYSTGKDCQELGDKYILCNGGLRSAEGIDMSPYVDKIIRVAMRDTEVLGVYSVVNDAPTLKSAEITALDNNSITVKLNGGTKTFKIEDNNNFSVGNKVDVEFKGNNNYLIELSN